MDALAKFNAKYERQLLEEAAAKSAAVDPDCDAASDPGCPRQNQKRTARMIYDYSKAVKNLEEFTMSFNFDE